MRARLLAWIRSFHRWEIAIFVAALSSRLVFNLLLHRPGDFLVSDMHNYDVRASRLVLGLRDPWDTFTPMGYPAFLAAVFGLTRHSFAASASCKRSSVHRRARSGFDSRSAFSAHAHGR